METDLGALATARANANGNILICNSKQTRPRTEYTYNLLLWPRHRARNDRPTYYTGSVTRGTTTAVLEFH